MFRVPGPVSVPLRASADAAGRALTRAAAGPASDSNALFLPGHGLRLTGGPTRFAAWSGDTRVLFADVDEAARTVVLTDGWWYRGTYRIHERGGAAWVEYRVENAARRRRLAAQWGNKLFIAYRTTMLGTAVIVASRIAKAVDAEQGPEVGGEAAG